MALKKYMLMSLAILLSITLFGCGKRKDTSVARKIVKNDVRTMFET